MAYEPISFASFGAGLNLADKADAVSEQECIDALNVEFTETGAVKQRSGYAVFTDVELDGQGDTLFPHYESDGTRHLIVGDTATGQLTALNTSGVEVDIETNPSTGGCFGFQRYGAPGTERTYIGNGVDTIWYYDGATFTQAGATSPEGGALGISPGEGGNTSNRLVNARFTNATGGPSGAATNPSTIWFSAAGDPTTWGANDYLHLDPGDGEAIQDIVSWREFLFVFKETKFYVFTGESVDSSGNPIFNYYTVNTGHGAVGPRAVCADEKGVYFVARDGLMRTRGGEPEHLSDAIEPIFVGGASDYFEGGTLNWSAVSLIACNAHEEQVFINYSTNGTSNNRTIQYDTHDGWFSLWDIAAADMVSWRGASGQPALYFTYPTGNNEGALVSSTYTSDGAIDTASRADNTAGVAITARWRSGWFDYQLPITKTIRESKVWGYGNCYLGVSYDFKVGAGDLTLLEMEDPTLDTWGGTTWGGGTWASPSARIAALRRYAVRGTVFSTSFYNATLDNTFVIARLTHHLRESRIPSIKTAVRT